MSPLLGGMPKDLPTRSLAGMSQRGSGSAMGDSYRQRDPVQAGAWTGAFWCQALCEASAFPYFQVHTVPTGRGL